MDFDLLLMSVIPHKYFHKFLVEEKPETLPYLQIVRLYKLYKNDLDRLNAKLSELENQDYSNSLFKRKSFNIESFKLGSIKS